METGAQRRFIEYLQNTLCSGNGFQRIGPRSFLFNDGKEIVFVKVARDTLIVITDGEFVVDHMEMTHLVLDANEDPTTGEVVDAAGEMDVFDDYLQRILEKF